MRLLRFKEKFIPFLEKPEVRTIGDFTAEFKTLTTRLSALPLERHHAVISKGRYKPILKTGIILQVTHVEPKRLNQYSALDLIADVGYNDPIIFRNEIIRLNGIKEDEIDQKTFYLNTLKFIGKIVVTQQVTFDELESTDNSI